MTTPYWERFQPTLGARPPRAWFTSDAPTLDLSGDWKFRWSPRAARHWTSRNQASTTATGRHCPCRLTGNCTDTGLRPTRTSGTRFPLTRRACRAITPPAITAPLSRCRSPGEGSASSSGSTGWIPAREFGSTEPRSESRQQVRCRSSSMSPTPSAGRTRSFWPSGCTSGPRQLPGGPGHVVDVGHLPAGHPAPARPGALTTISLHADYDHRTGGGTLTVEVDASVSARVTVPELGIDAAAGEVFPLPAVEPWSAESPRLYDGELATDASGPAADRLSPGGHRRGRPDRQRAPHRPPWGEPAPSGTSSTGGRSRRDDARRRAAPEAAQHQRVRTSHYPPDPDFLDLSDTYGL